jgi:hypothetical protein
MSCHEKVTRKIKENSRKMTCCAKVAQCKRHGLQGSNQEGVPLEQGQRKNWTRNQSARGTWKGWIPRWRQLMHKEFTKETRNLGFEGQLRLGSKREFNQTLRKANGLEIAKQIARSPVPLQKSKHWTLWRG